MITTLIITAVLFIIAVVIVILYSLTSANNTVNKQKIKKTNIIDKFNLKIGDEVKLWPKPNTNEIHFFAKGTTGGEGRIAIMTNKKIYKLVEEGKVYGKITNIKNVDIKVDIFPYED